MRRALILACLPLAAAGRLPAQSPAPRTFPEATAHYGKWLTAGAAAAFTAMAAHEHARSRREWQTLLAFCRTAEEACTVGADGRYVQPEAETRYQRSLYYDRRANRRILGAQASVLVTAALFLLDLHPGRDGPDNIPFAPLRVSASASDGRVEVGVRLAW